MKTVVRRAFKSITASALIVATAGLLSGCRTATEPFTGRRQFILTSPKTEMRMSLASWQDILKKEKASTDQAKIAAVKRVGENISAVANRDDFEWEFRVLADGNPNAFCLPGGKVAVYEALFDYVANDAELAAVVGHEIGHAIARHGGERMTQAMLVNIGASAAAFALTNKASEEQARWLMAYGGLTSVGFLLPFSRVHEYAADEIGMMLMARAGYDPNAAVSFWTKFSDKKDASSPLMEFLSTHPLDAKRIQRLNTALPKAKAEYDVAPFQHGLGQIHPKTISNEQ